MNIFVGNNIRISQRQNSTMIAIANDLSNTLKIRFIKIFASCVFNLHVLR